MESTTMSTMSAIDNGLSNYADKNSQGDNAWDQSDEDKKEASRIAARWGFLDTDAINFKTHWQELNEFIIPRKQDVIAIRLPGDRRNSDLYDTTAIYCNEQLASALHGFLTNPETKFFEIVFGDPKLDEDPVIKAWCQEVGDRMFRVLNNTNFQTEIYEIYLDLGAIGTSCMYMGEHEDNIVHFNARAMKEIRIDENSLGIVDVVYRCYKSRPRQIVQDFGYDNVSSQVKRAYDSGSEEQLDLIHAVEPLDEKSPNGHKFKSTYILKDAEFILSKSGYREFPYAVPRWSKTTGEKYGRGPGMAMLPDIEMVNAMMLTVIQAAQLTVNPPLAVEDDGVIGVVRMNPGGLTVVRPGSAPIRPLIENTHVDIGEKIVEDVRSRIRSGFYVDQFQLPKGPQKTAEEVQQTTENQLRLMGPVLGRQHWEFLKPVITRVFDLMYKKGEVPPIPQKIQGKNFDVRYSSMIARAQRINEMQNYNRAFQMMAPIAQMKPEVIDNVKTDKMVRDIWEGCGLPFDNLRNQQELDKLRKQQADQKAQQQKMIQEQHQSQIAKNVAPLAQVAQDSQGGPQGGGT